MENKMQPDAAMRMILEAVATALYVRRNRMGRLEVDSAAGDPLRKLAIMFEVGGSQDAPEQAVKVIRAYLAQNPIVR